MGKRRVLKFSYRTLSILPVVNPLICGVLARCPGELAASRAREDALCPAATAHNLDRGPLRGHVRLED